MHERLFEEAWERWPTYLQGHDLSPLWSIPTVPRKPHGIEPSPNILGEGRSAHAPDPYQPRCPEPLYSTGGRTNLAKLDALA